MKYMGSKSRIAKDIVPIIQKYIDANNIKKYIEPFCGGCNVIDKIVCETKIASDNHNYLISLYRNLDKIKTLPTFITKEHYSEVRNCFNNHLDTFDDWYVGAIGFLASYNGRFFDGGYAGIVNTKYGKKRDYYSEAKRNIITQTPNLVNINFACVNYLDLSVGCDNVIYCDPPYFNTKQYGTNKKFDHDKFWEWVRKQSEYNTVFVSELQSPEDFDCIWEQTILRTIDNNKRVSATEKLFIYRKCKYNLY